MNKFKPIQWFLVSISPLGLVGVFVIMFHFELFDSKINYVEDTIPMLLVALSLGFGMFCVTSAYNGFRGGLIQTSKMLGGLFLAYLIGSILNG